MTLLAWICVYVGAFPVVGSLLGGWLRRCASTQICVR